MLDAVFYFKSLINFIMGFMEKITKEQHEKDFKDFNEIRKNRKPILCICCSNEIPIKEALAQLKAGVGHFCSQYCFEKHSGNFNLSDFTLLKK